MSSRRVSGGGTARGAEMLDDEIRLFFDEIRKLPRAQPVAPSPAESPLVNEMRTISEKSAIRAAEYLDELEDRLLAFSGENDPAEIEAFDSVIEIIRQRRKPPQERLEEIGRMLVNWPRLPPRASRP